jgi:hypothetical protein
MQRDNLDSTASFILMKETCNFVYLIKATGLNVIHTLAANHWILCCNEIVVHHLRRWYWILIMIK